jgi:hypothetical protein
MTSMCSASARSTEGSRLRKRAVRGQIINRLCRSLQDLHARRVFYSNEAAYCLAYGLDREERQAVQDRDFVTLIQLGAHVRELDSLAALSGLNTVQAIRMRGR